jgi:hypothetical protein
MLRLHVILMCRMLSFFVFVERFVRNLIGTWRKVVLRDIFNQRGYRKPNNHGVLPCVADGGALNFTVMSGPYYLSNLTPPLVRWCNGTTAGLGYLESSLDCVLKKSSIGSECPHYNATGYGQSE